MMPYPEYLDYIVWDYTDKWNPKIKGFKKNTPPELIEQWKKDSKDVREALKNGKDL